MAAFLPCNWVTTLLAVSIPGALIDCMVLHLDSASLIWYIMPFSAITIEAGLPSPLLGTIPLFQAYIMGSNFTVYLDSLYTRHFMAG